MNRMLDPTILMNLEVALPPPRPAMVEERVLLSPKGDIARRTAERMASSYEAEVNVWVQTLARIRREFNAMYPTTPMSPAELAQLNRLIEEFEFTAEARSVDLVRLEKKLKREVKRWFAIDPGVGASTRSLGHRLVAADKLAIEAVLEHAMYLRAVRAERSPDVKRSEAFDNPQDLRAALLKLVAA